MENNINYKDVLIWLINDYNLLADKEREIMFNIVETNNEKIVSVEIPNQFIIKEISSSFGNTIYKRVFSSLIKSLIENGK
jgi:hypothetical protein